MNLERWTMRYQQHVLCALWTLMFFFKASALPAFSNPPPDAVEQRRYKIVLGESLYQKELVRYERKASKGESFETFETIRWNQQWRAGNVLLATGVAGMTLGTVGCALWVSFGIRHRIYSQSGDNSVNDDGGTGDGMGLAIEPLTQVGYTVILVATGVVIAGGVVLFLVGLNKKKRAVRILKQLQEKSDVAFLSRFSFYGSGVQLEF